VFKPSLPPCHQDYGKDRPLDCPSMIRDISFSGMDLVTDGRIMIVGKPDLPVEGVQFHDLRIRYVVTDDATPFRNAGSTSFIPGDYAEVRSANAAFVVQHARDIVVDGLRLRWPAYPVGDWHLFGSPHRFMSPFWTGHEDEIRRGERRTPMSLVWARDAEITIRGRDLCASEADCPLMDADSASVVACQGESAERP
jgi:hypothetical protein